MRTFKKHNKSQKVSFRKIIILAIVVGFVSCQANPDNLKFEMNLLKGIEWSKKLNKPIFLHFTGYGCMGSNEFMWDLITSRKIQNKLNNEFITVQLYVDDRRKLEKSDTLNIYKLGFTDKTKEQLKDAKTIGHVNALIEADFFNRNSQPYYVIMDSDRNLLIEPFGYTNRDKQFFLAKLDEGLKRFKEKK